MVLFQDGHPREPSPIPDGEYLDPKEFAIRYDIPVETVRTWVKRKLIPSVNYFGRIFIPSSCDCVSFKKWVKNL